MARLALLYGASRRTAYLMFSSSRAGGREPPGCGDTIAIVDLGVLKIGQQKFVDRECLPLIEHGPCRKTPVAIEEVLVQHSLRLSGELYLPR